MLGGTWVKYQEIADELQVSRDTVKNNLKKLADGGYITMDRKPYGAVIEVTNSKKWMQRQGTSSPSGQGESSPSESREGESSLSRQGTSSPSRQGESSLSDERQGTSSPSGQGESSPSNGLYSLQERKEQKEAAALASLGIEQTPPEFDGLLESVMMLMGRTRFSGKELDLMKSLLRQGVPTDTILTTLEEKLQEYAAANDGRYFSSFRYVEAPILAKHELNTMTAKLEMDQGYAQTAATQSPGVELDPLEQRLRELMSS